ncbi:SipW-dependent-type signal peptide-containing protein [Cuneatibacter caecimuris]|uniref:Putative ribosomally synthesized peptide with SipW-like signal peptide n=1 Tax=Cuneatibacter caecimuris TaxID=1796618 RepID=A0A4Q7PKD5_9FIRM|nr:SipW-dependent-type signal peptide-containing protein [Cuneatibacter caecimuris]RZT01183.1 putative ribosomally synthesized peptide with SipW-like signal peptide [Cuneatibacter caecimuris]
MRKMRFTKKTRFAAVAAAGLLVFATIGVTMAYLTDKDSATNTFTVGEIDIQLTEPSWDNSQDGLNRHPGDTVTKDPTVTALDGDSYMRVKVEILDDEENLITDAERLKQIKSIIRYDAAGTALVEGTAYKKETIEALPMVNPDFKADTTAADAADNVLYFNYVGGDGIFSKGEKVVLFNRIAVPTEFDNQDMAILDGDTYTMDDQDNLVVSAEGKGYQLRLTAEAVQSKNVANADAAWDLLDTEHIQQMTLQP